jgi:hypothetical protein
MKQQAELPKRYKESMSNMSKNRAEKEAWQKHEREKQAAARKRGTRKRRIRKRKIRKKEAGKRESGGRFDLSCTGRLMPVSFVAGIAGKDGDLAEGRDRSLVRG